MHDRRRRTRDWAGTFDQDGGRGGLGWAPPLEELLFRLTEAQVNSSTLRVQLIGHFKACMPEIYLHIDARMADYMATHP